MKGIYHISIVLLVIFLSACSSGGGGSDSTPSTPSIIDDNTSNLSDTLSPTLSSTTQTFTTTAGTALTLGRVTATDNVDTNVVVTQTGSVDFDTIGTYTITYTASDSANNSSSIVHTYVVNSVPVIVIPDTTAPVLSSTTQTFTTTVGTALTLVTVTADDNSTVTMTGSVDFNTVGSYDLVYSATDLAGNVATPVTHTYVVNEVPNNAPTVTDDNISIVLPEYTTSITDLLTNVSDTDGDNLTVLSVIQLDGNTTLPTGYSLTDGNLTIDATSIDVADGVNLNYDLNVTVTDSEDNVSYIINSTIQDSSNDAILTATDIGASATVNNGTDLNISLVLSDADGVDSVTYNIYSVSDATTSLDSGILNDDLNDNNYSVTTNSSSLADGDYTLEIIATGVDGGEGFESEVTKTHNFTITTPNTAPTAIDGSVNGGGASSLTFSMTDVISDTEDADSVLTIVVTTQSTKGTVSINGTNATFNMNSGQSGASFFLFKVRDSDGAESDEKRYDLITFDNF